MNNNSIPIFRIFDEAKAQEFYLDYLGFEVNLEHRYEENAPLYIGIIRNGCEIHLSEHVGDATPGSTVRIFEENLTKLHQSLAKKNYTTTPLSRNNHGGQICLCWILLVTN